MRRIVLILMLCSLTAFARDLTFEQEAFITHLSPQTAGERVWRLHLQHYFNSGDISGMNFRLGYGLGAATDLYIEGVLHTAQIRETDLESYDIGLNLVRQMSGHADDDPLDVAL